MRVEKTEGNSESRKATPFQNPFKIFFVENGCHVGSTVGAGGMERGGITMID
jgi:hypothetical protein